MYEHPVLKFLDPGTDESWGEVRDLIFGPGTDLDLEIRVCNPDVSKRARARLAALEQLWRELRSDILAAQQEYSPNRRPWGCRFD
jgi:hypothetical protein